MKKIESSRNRIDSKVPEETGTQDTRGKLRFSQGNLGMAPSLESTNTENNSGQLGRNEDNFKEFFSTVLGHLGHFSALCPAEIALMAMVSTLRPEV